MKNKEIIQMIKNKAQEKEVPNVLNELKEKLNTEVVNQPEFDFESTKPRFNLKALYASLTFVLALSIVLVISLLYQSPSINLLEDSDFGDQVMLSAISTTEIIGSNETLSLETSFVLVDDNPEDDYVENQIDDVLKYSEMIETVLMNQEAFNKTYLKSDKEQYEYMMRFSFYDLNADQITYTLYYNQIIDHENQTYVLETELVTQNETYLLNIEGELDAQAFVMTYHINQQEQITTTYQMGEMMNEFIVRRLNQNEIIQESMITYSNKAQVNLSFTRGQAKGNYEFTLDQTLPNQKGMNIRYQINSIDEGSILIKVDEENREQFIIEIRPDHRPPSVIERERPYGPPKRDEPGNPNMPNRGN
jgi:hypothetical protein